MTMLRSGITFALALLIGCDRTPKAPAAPATRADNSVPVAKNIVRMGAMQCQMKVVAPLLPKRATHLAVDPASNVYFVQESNDGDDTLFVIGSGDVSNTTPLSARGILTVLGEKGSGNIQSIAAAADGNVYFLFAGGTLTKTVACFGRFETRTGLIRILAREQQLAAISGMGLSLALARGTLVASGNTLWFWLHHSDASAMFALRPGDFPPDGEMLLPRPLLVQSRDGTLNMNRPELTLSSGNNEWTLLLDTWTAALWKIDLTGSASVLQSLVGLPRLMSAPGANLQSDVMLFAAPSEPIEARVDQRITPLDVETHYPSLLILHEGKIFAIPRDDIQPAAGLPLETMQLEELIYEPRRDTWIGYDAASGQIVRARLSPKGSR